MIKEIKSLHVNTLVYELEEFISQYEIDIIDKGISETLENFDKVNLMLYVNIEGENLASFIKEFQVGIK
jgi:alkyl hydroperoxide reductase subunit AhpF